jgi:hypothetical protein
MLRLGLLFAEVERVTLMAVRLEGAHAQSRQPPNSQSARFCIAGAAIQFNFSKHSQRISFVCPLPFAARSVPGCGLQRIGVPAQRSKPHLRRRGGVANPQFRTSMLCCRMGIPSFTCDRFDLVCDA